MGILIIIVIATLVIAAVGAGVYVIVFRAKHKKEILQESQINNTVPNYNTIPGQEQGPQNSTANLGAPIQAQQPTQQSPVMNDIQTNAQPEMPVPPVSDSLTQPLQSANFNEIPGLTPEAPIADNPSVIPQAPENNIPSPSQPETTSNILDDSGTVGPVENLTNNQYANTEVDINDSSVPITQEDDTLEEIESMIGEAEVTEGLEEREKEDGTYDPNDFQPNPMPSAPQTSETANPMSTSAIPNMAPIPSESTFQQQPTAVAQEQSPAPAPEMFANDTVSAPAEPQASGTSMAGSMTPAAPMPPENPGPVSSEPAVQAADGTTEPPHMEI